MKDISPEKQVYFFKRKKDGEVFAVDHEREAARIVQRRDFRDRFEYVGMTDGSLYLEELKRIERKIDSEIREVLDKQDLSKDAYKRRYIQMKNRLRDKHQEKLEDALELEIGLAEESGASPPRVEIWRKMNLNGNPIQNPALKNALNQFK